MRRTRLSMKKLKAPEEIVDDDSSSSDLTLENNRKPAKIPSQINRDKCDLSESSSDSDIESYIKPVKELDLTSNPRASEFEAIEADIFSGINRLSDSDEAEIESTQIPIQIQNFKDIELYNARLESAKQSVEKYEARKQAGITSVDISNLLATGEKYIDDSQKQHAQSSEDDGYSDEKEDWEEIQHENKPENLDHIIKDVQITVEMPGAVAKKKGIDLMAAIKRRINRVKKEQQVYIHKVHLLGWMAHGNYVNKVLNRESIQAVALSLLPSQHCYPSSRVDLTYLEQILTWYRKTIKNVEQVCKADLSLEESLHIQMYRKEAHDQNVFVYIFICILRSLGISVRLVMNLLVEPLRPHNSELCSLSNKASTSEPKSSKEKSSIPNAGNLNSVPSTSAVNTKPVTLSSKLNKITSTATSTDSAEKKLKSKETSCTPHGANNATISNSRQKADNFIIKSDNHERRETNKLKKPSVSSINKNEAGEVSSKRSETSDRLRDILFSKPSSPRKSELEKNVQGNKRLSERSVNNFPAKRTHSDLETKTNAPSRSECEIVDIAAERNSDHKKSETKSKKQSASKDVTDTKATSTRNSAKLITKDDSKKLAAKRTSITSSNADKDNHKDGKKKKKTATQLDGPNDSSDEENVNFIYTIPQLDGKDSSGSDKKSKPNLRKLSIRSQSNKSKECYKKGANESLKALQKSNEKSDASVPTSIFSSSQSSYFSSPDKKVVKKSTDVRSDIVNLVKTHIGAEKQSKTSGRQRKTKSPEVQIESESDSDSDFVPSSSKKKTPRDDYLAPKIKVKRRVLPRKELDKLKSGDDDTNLKNKKGIDIWVEVFLEAEEKWISVDVLKGQVHCVKEIFSRASHPISYILSWDNSNYIKDVTQRYCTTNWNTVTRKLRLEPEWWAPTLKPFEGPKTATQREEDEELEQQQIEQPLPKAISEYKNHPLYVLKRHLLKFEAIYPPDAPTLGFIRKEAVYSRTCVHNLHSREIWVKHAKVVKPKQTAYKIVKARPKYDRYSNTFITDQPLEIFGSWQVNDYEPPIAENGIVPKNAYGNVELFKICMLPIGTVQLDLPGLQKIARKLNIDCAPAVVGFDFHGGFSHPTFEGLIVCEEFADTLTVAWYQEQEEAAKREEEKIDKRVYGNWRRLIKGLLIRERLQKRYDFAQPSTSGKKKSKLVLKKNKLCSDSDSD